MTDNVAYVNDSFVVESEARVSIFDRGYLFGDGVYEVIPVVNGSLVDLEPHMNRLIRSTFEMRMDMPMEVDVMVGLMRELIERNNVTEGRVYLQVTRGVADRDFPFPTLKTLPSFIMFARQVSFLETEAATKGIRVMLAPDIRWGRRDIKTVMLAPSALAKQRAKDEGYDDAWFVQDGFVTEATSANAYIVKDSRVYTRDLSEDILAGCTRQCVLKLAEREGVEIVERPFTPAEAVNADEAFITSATTLVTPVVEIEGKPLGDGRVGPLARKLRKLYIDYVTGVAEAV